MNRVQTHTVCTMQIDKNRHNRMINIEFGGTTWLQTLNTIVRLPLTLGTTLHPDMHAPTLAHMLNLLQLLVLNLYELLQILCLFYSLCTALQPHTTLQSEYRLLCLIVYG